MGKRRTKTHHWVRIKPPTDDEIVILKLANMVKMPRGPIGGIPFPIPAGFVYGRKHKHGRGFSWWRYERVNPS